MDTWGLETIIDLKGCDHNAITSIDTIKQYLVELVSILDMEAYGEPIIERFGKDDKYGYTAIQLIQTSNITMHFDEENNDVYINIFSCKEYDPVDAVDFSINCFMSTASEYIVVPRGTRE